jgi:hypothetical protein
MWHGLLVKPCHTFDGAYPNECAYQNDGAFSGDGAFPEDGAFQRIFFIVSRSLFSTE